MDSLKNQLPQNLKIKVRQYENLCQKKIRNKWSLIFNDVCLIENIMPIYTKFNHKTKLKAKVIILRKLKIVFKIYLYKYVVCPAL